MSYSLNDVKDIFDAFEIAMKLSGEDKDLCVELVDNHVVLSKRNYYGDDNGAKTELVRASYTYNGILLQMNEPDRFTMQLDNTDRLITYLQNYKTVYETRYNALGGGI